MLIQLKVFSLVSRQGLLKLVAWSGRCRGQLVVLVIVVIGNLSHHSVPRLDVYTRATTMMKCHTRY